MSYSDDPEYLSNDSAWDSQADGVDDDVDDGVDGGVNGYVYAFDGSDVDDDDIDNDDGAADDIDDGTGYGYGNGYGYDTWPADAYGNLLPAAGLLEQPTIPYTPHGRAVASERQAQRRAPVATAPTRQPATAPSAKGQPRGSQTAFTLLCTAALVVLLGAFAVLFVSRQLAAPVSASQAFCKDLQQQQYGPAYDLLDARLRQTYTRAQFTAANAALDTAEGRVLACTKSGAATADHFIYVNSTATVPLTITRERQGTLTGSLRLLRQNGDWQIEAIDLPLLGVDLGAVDTTLDYCAALRANHFSAAYALLTSSQQKQTTVADYAATQTMHTRVDGSVSQCLVVAVNPGNTASAASLQVSITRAVLGQRSGALRLTREAAGWRINQAAAALTGTNITPLITGNSFCADIAHGDLAHAYSLTSSSYQQQNSASGFRTLFDPGSDFTFGGCQPYVKSYTVAASSASYALTLALAPVDPARSAASVALTLTFVYENNAWKIDQIAIGK